MGCLFCFRLGANGGLDDGDLGSEANQDLYQLAAGGAAAKNDQGVRYGFGADNIVGGPVIDLGQAEHEGNGGLGAGDDDDANKGNG